MSLALHYWMRGAHHCSGPPVSEMIYTVSSGTLNPSIPYHTIPPRWKCRHPSGPQNENSRTATALLYITAVGYLKLESLKQRRMEVDKKFFNDISQPDKCLHHLLPPPRDTQLVTRLRYANMYLVPFTKTKWFCSVISFALVNYVEWLY